MTDIPLELPVKASEAAAFADFLFQHTETKPINDELRNRLAARLTGLEITSFQPLMATLQRDPRHTNELYVVVDARDRSWLLHLTPASSGAAPLFRKTVLVGRMRPGGGREVVVNAIPFHSSDHENIRTYAEEVDRAFLPRPQGTQPAIATGNRHPEISLPAAFEAFRKILRDQKLNLASTVQLSATREMTTAAALEGRDGENPTAAGHTRVSIEHLYHAGLWAAIRAGWREGYTAEADHIIITGNNEEEIRRSMQAGKLAIDAAAGYTKFTTDTSRMFDMRADERHPNPYSQAELEEKWERIFSEAERAWMEDEFARPFALADHTYTLPRTEIRRLAVKFGESLKLNEELYDYIKSVKAGLGSWKTFDFEPSIDEAETLTTPEEMIFYMHWLKLRERPAQLVPPNLGFKKRQAYPETMEALESYVAHKMWPELATRVAREFGGQPLDELAARVSELAAVARHFNGTLSIHSGSGKQAAVLRHIGRSTAGRWNYKISGELQLQLFDVLSEQPAGSAWRGLYERMVARCNAFAEQHAFGEESELARKYTSDSLGDALGGRTDGNKFLVFWLGNIVGCRDAGAPDGDTRFFAEKLAELPADLLKEVRRRNTAYIVWLAEQLRG